MNYQEFKEKVLAEIKIYLPAQYGKFKVKVQEINKTNVKKDGMMIFNPELAISVSPTIYLEDFYEEFCNNNDFKGTMRKMAAIYDSSVKQAPSLEFLQDFSSGKAKNKIICQLINTDQNKEWLRDVPHRVFEDLSVVYKYVMAMDQNGLEAVLIRNDLLNKLNMSEEELFPIAMENTQRLMPTTIRTMREVQQGILSECGMPQELIDNMLSEAERVDEMYIVSNSTENRGAIGMLNQDTLCSICEKMNTDDLYVLPSSIHEVIVVAASVGNPEELAKMVHEINMEQVSLDERLSNQVYQFNGKTKELAAATHTLQKSLDRTTYTVDLGEKRR